MAVKYLSLFESGTISVAQMPAVDGGFVHILATPTRHGLLYYIGTRWNRRTKKFKIVSSGFRTTDRAYIAMARYIRHGKVKFSKKDPAQKRVYDWENAFVVPHFRHERLTREGILQLIYRACGDLCIPPPSVTFIKADFSYVLPCENKQFRMILCDSAETNNTAWVLHELAHYVMALKSPRYDFHGPAYMREYIRLIVQYGGFEIDAILDSLRTAKIRFYLP